MVQDLLEVAARQDRKKREEWHFKGSVEKQHLALLVTVIIIELYYINIGLMLNEANLIQKKKIHFKDLFDWANICNFFQSFLQLSRDRVIIHKNNF